MTAGNDVWACHLERDGFVVLPGVFTGPQMERTCRDLEAAFRERGGASIRTQGGAVYAARNVLDLWPEGVLQVAQHPPLPKVLAESLGPGYGLVRVLFFDKPPEQTWALPWHKDLTIAVRDNRRPSRLFTKPTTKAGVPHVEAPREVLEAMLTARVHLDEVTEENGPLRVVTGSHLTGKDMVLGAVPPRSVLASVGDVLLIRPLVAHCSNRSHAGTRRRRRVLHLEFAASPRLPEGYAWHDFRAG